MRRELGLDEIMAVEPRDETDALIRKEIPDKKAATCQPRRGPLPSTQSAGTLIFDL